MSDQAYDQVYVGDFGCTDAFLDFDDEVAVDCVAEPAELSHDHALAGVRQRRLVELVSLHRAALLKYVKRMLSSAEDAEDIVQETCIRMLRVRDLWRSEREARAVLYTIATNLARDEMRRRKARCYGHHQPYETLDLIADQEQMEDVLDRSIARDIIAKSLVRLPSRYREVFSLHVEEHLSYRAIARQLGVSTKTVERDLSGVYELCLDRFEPRRNAA